MKHHQTTQPLITPYPPAGEEERVHRILQGVEEHLGFVPDGLRTYTLSPPLLEHFVGNVGYFMSHPTLSQKLLASIRYLVSSRADCHFCINMNESILINLGVDAEALEAMRENPGNAPLEEKEKTLLSIALKAVADPEAVSQADLDQARAEGWSDRELFDTVVIASNNNAFNTLLKTFNVERQGVFA